MVTVATRLVRELTHASGFFVCFLCLLFLLLLLLFFLLFLLVLLVPFFYSCVIRMQSVAQKLGVSLHRAQQIKSMFAKAFPGVFRFREEAIERCRLDGFVETLTHRKRYLHNINSSEVCACRWVLSSVNVDSPRWCLFLRCGVTHCRVERSFLGGLTTTSSLVVVVFVWIPPYVPCVSVRRQQPKERNEAERQAINTLCQASAADLMKVAMINVEAALQRLRGGGSGGGGSGGAGGAASCRGAGARSKARARAQVVLQIHDELLIELDEDLVGVAVPAIEAAMVNSAHGFVGNRNGGAPLIPNGGRDATGTKGHHRRLDIQNNSSVGSNSHVAPRHAGGGSVPPDGGGGNSEGEGGLINLRVPLEVTFQVGRRWGSLRTLATKQLLSTTTSKAR